MCRINEEAFIGQQALKFAQDVITGFQGSRQSYPVRRLIESPQLRAATVSYPETEHDDRGNT